MTARTQRNALLAVALLAYLGLWFSALGPFGLLDADFDRYVLGAALLLPLAGAAVGAIAGRWSVLLAAPATVIALVVSDLLDADCLLCQVETGWGFVGLTLGGIGVYNAASLAIGVAIRRRSRQLAAVSLLVVVMLGALTIANERAAECAAQIAPQFPVAPRGFGLGDKVLATFLPAKRTERPYDLNRTSLRYCMSLWNTSEAGGL